SKLLGRQGVDHADISPGVSRDHAVGLEGDEPALVPALGGKLSAIQGVVRVIAVSEGIEIHHDEHTRPHEAFGKDRKGLANLGMEFIHIESNPLVRSLDTAESNVKVVNESMGGRVTDNPPVTLLVIRVLVQPEPEHQIIQVRFREGLAGFVGAERRNRRERG
ncbi:MAG TPA: hypothetical protein VLS45_07970, partial [Methylomicrobium sp.]|nr:hypothetical protein [Methylomicrobium sp.]